MKKIKIPNYITAIIGFILILISAITIISAGNKAGFAFSIINARSLILVLFAAGDFAVALWLLIISFKEKGALYWICTASFFVIGVCSIIYGIYSDIVSTGAFGIIGSVLTLASIIMCVVYFYTANNKVVCTCLEAVFLLFNLALCIGAIRIINNEFIAKEFIVLLIMPFAFSLAAIGAMIWRFIKPAQTKVVKYCALAMLAVGVLCYSAAFSTALLCVNSHYLCAFNMPTGFLAHGLLGEETVVYADFSGERAVFSEEAIDGEYKGKNGFFSYETNFYYFPDGKK